VRLVKAEFSGFGRLAAGKINLDNRVIAVVGPNEAGKTTLLKALAYIDNSRALSAAERSRGMEVTDDHIVSRVQYLIGLDDKNALKEFDLEVQPESLWLNRTAAGGAMEMRVEPMPQKARKPLEKAVVSLTRAASEKALHALEERRDDEADEETPRATFRHRVDSFAAKFAADTHERGAVAAASDSAHELASLLAEFDEFEILSPITDPLRAIASWLSTADPAALVAERLYQRTPDILLFSDDDRNLASTYELSEEVVSDPPVALQSLTRMAGLSLPALWKTLQNGDEGERETLILQANDVLKVKFAETWKQSQITVHLKTEDTVLSVRIMQGGKRITQFHERSAGLKMFVAVIAFLAARGTSVPPILLIDEAETHLHIDAQADLVNTFMTQRQAAKIIYTTHSPACLPPDLGSNIRAVLPDRDHGDRSKIEASFWHSAAGYSPLMLAMGAGAAAFSAARFVVLSEGPSEMLLLPSLIRQAVGLDDLEYQVAPGLSEVPSALYPELDLEGARVAYLLDGDEGGVSRRRALVDGGVQEDKIVMLDALTLENLMLPEGYISAVSLLLEECNPSKTIPPLPNLPEATAVTWPSVFEKWAVENDLKLPGKRVVASRIVEEGLALPSEEGKKALQRAHRDIMRILSGSSNSSRI
jgi:predicted ATP-dependent endonuclease of OLD family